MTPFEAIQYVGTPMALIAFIVAVVAYVHRSSLEGRRKLMELAPPEDRGRLLEAAIRDFTTVSTETLSREQRYQLALRLIEERAAKSRTTAVVAVLIALILAGSVALVTLREAGAQEGPVGLTVRVHGPGGIQDVLTSGTVTLDTGDDLDTRPIGPEGEVRFAAVPRGSLARASLIADVPGYERPDRAPLRGLEGGVVYLEMAPRRTRLYGTVVDASRAPVPDVVVAFDGGQAVDTTDPAGAFAVSVAAPPGARVPVRALRDGAVGYNDMITVPDGAPLTLFFAPRDGG